LNPVPLRRAPIRTASRRRTWWRADHRDFDGDGLPEVGIAPGRLRVWKPGGLHLDSRGRSTASSATGAPCSIFEGKGKANVVYSDHVLFRVYDGRPAPTLVQEKNASCTAYEMPIVADIDGSGRAKVLVPNNKSAGM